jgi:hypothetical protein
MAGSIAGALQSALAWSVDSARGAVIPAKATVAMVAKAAPNPIAGRMGKLVMVTPF